MKKWLLVLLFASASVLAAPKDELNTRLSKMMGSVPNLPKR